MAGAFASAALEIESAARLMLRYAAELERLQREAAAAARESAHWHQEIATWTGKVNQAQSALTQAQYELTAAQGRHAAAAAQGPRGAAAASAASADVARWEGEVRRTQADLARARQELSRAHEQFSHWQERARVIRDAAMTAGEELGLALLVITIVAPPLPGAPDYPALEPTPGILLNDEPAQGQQEGERARAGTERATARPRRSRSWWGPTARSSRPIAARRRRRSGTPNKRSRRRQISSSRGAPRNRESPCGRCSGGS